MSWSMSVAMALAIVAFGPRDARGDTKDGGVRPESEVGASSDRDFHVRGGFGMTPVVFRRTDHLPEAHHGVGAFFTAFAQLPYRLSLGGGFDWERYSYETATSEDYTDGVATFPAEKLTHTRLLGVFEWDLLERGFVNPYLLGVAGWGWEQATKTGWQCSPETASGPVVGGGAGVDIAVSPWLAVGLEYRITTLPLMSESMCTMAYIPDEPIGTPGDFIPQRIALTLSVSDAF